MHVFLRSLSVSILVLVVTSSFIHAAPAVTEETVYYYIQGTTAKDLRAEMNKLGVMEKDGKRYDGYTNWYVSWKYFYDTGRSDCRISSVQTTVRIKFTLPKWTDRSSAPEELRQKWDDYIAALIRHEENHRDIAVEAAAQIEQAIAEIASRATCDELGRASNALARRILDDSRKRQKEYDAQTRHGRLEGVRFP